MRQEFDKDFFEKYGEPLSDVIKRLYIDERQSIHYICRLYKINVRTVMRRMEYLGIHARTGAEVTKLQYQKYGLGEKMAKSRKTRDEKWFEEYRQRRSLRIQANPTWSKYEIEANKYLAPLGFIHEIAIGGHNFDFGHPRSKVVVEIDGGNWHESQKKNVYDRRKAKILRGLGWKLYRVQVKDTDQVGERIGQLPLIFNRTPK